ncbi:MAG: addiction module protein [Kiritimatiellia bacterium]|nr:addiction module protein [Lentisphaerota bacterium]
MTTLEINKMPTKDKIILMEEIWDSLLHDDGEIESPAWHEDILRERMLKIQDGSAEYISIDELKFKK